MEQRGLSVSLSVMTVSPAKMAESIKMQFRLWTRVGSRNRVLGGVQISTYEGKNFVGKTVAGPGHAGTYPAIDILRATQQGAAPARCGC